MRAAITNEDHRFDIVTVADPAPGAGELLLRVGACGICGSDLKAVANMPAGLVMGHEFAGEVVAIGSGVDGRSADWSAQPAVTRPHSRRIPRCRLTARAARRVPMRRNLARDARTRGSGRLVA